jgi:hypothetical protein
MSSSHVQPAGSHHDNEADDDQDFDDLAVGRDRTGLPAIPLGVPPQGDRIDLGAIQSEFNTRATRRPSPNAGGEAPTLQTAAKNSTRPASIPMRTINTSTRVEQVPMEEDDEVRYRSGKLAPLALGFALLCIADVWTRLLPRAAFSQLDDYEPPERRPARKKLPKKSVQLASTPERGCACQPQLFKC